MIFKDFLCAVRLACNTQLFYLLGGAIVFLVVAAALSALFSGRQPATVAMDVSFSVVRIVLPLVAVIFVQDLVFGECDRRYYLGSLSYPRARVVFLAGRFATVLTLGVFFLVLMAIFQFLVVRFISNGYEQSSPVVFGWGYFFVLIFIFLDFLVVASVALLLSVFASSASFVLVGTFGFMFVARSFSAIVDLVGRDSSLVWGAGGYSLEFMPEGWLWLVLSVVIYALVLLVLAGLVFRVRRFA